MKRYLCWFAFVCVIAVPTVAAACWPMWGQRAYGPPAYSYPMYSPPPMYAGPQAWQMQPQAPQGQVLPPPRIETIPKHAAPSPAPAPGIGSSIPSPMPPAVDTVRPVSGLDAPPKKNTPPAPTMIEPINDPDLTFPKIEIPKNLRPDAKSPPLTLPKEPDLTSIPKVPAVGATKDPVLPAIPSPAPSPDSLIPPPSIPMFPETSKRDPLPSLTLPPDIPVAPPAKIDSTSRSSPLTATRRGEMTVSVFPAAGGDKVTGGYRTVGFYNHTSNDLALTIEGRAVKLPAKSYLHAQLGATFTWSHGEAAATRETVPDGAAGVEVVFRN